MNRIRVIAVAATLAALFVAATPVISAQDKPSNSRVARPSAQAASRTYAPRVIGRSSSLIVEGRIIGIQDNRISIKSARGAHYDFRIDNQTTTFDSGEVVSIATMDDIALSVSDLRVADWVEIVTEGAGNRTLARIITRVVSSGARIASR